MKDSWILVLIIIVIIAAISSLKKKSKSKNLEKKSWPFYAKKPLTNPEQILYYRLIDALPENIVLSQVQLSRFLGVKKGFNFNEWNNRINRMSIDFLICLKDSSIVAAIELDDKTHEREDRIQADEKKNKALADAGVRLIRWNVKNMPNTEAIKKELIY